jgi:predicted glycosyltransferase involved in capsule biosynthesis
MKKVEEFDWEWTRRKVMVIIPYYGERLRQMIYALSGIRTGLDDSEWGVIVGDDGCGHDISSVESIKNVKVVKVRNDGAPERNGCLCRNVLIKRCQSEWVVSSDPEIHWSGDYFGEIVKNPKCIMRTSKTRNISQTTAEAILDKNIDLENVNCEVFYDTRPDDPINKDSIQIYKKSFDSMTKWGIHYGIAIPTNAIKAIRGYDERIYCYGPDDADIAKRLLTIIPNSKFKLDSNGMLIKNRQFTLDCEETKGLIHKFHLVDCAISTHIFHKRLEGSYKRFVSERNENGFIRNRKVEWGESYDRI